MRRVIDNVTGSIADGKTADLFVHEGDPRQDLAVLDNTEIVIASGAVFRREA